MTRWVTGGLAVLLEHMLVYPQLIISVNGYSTILFTSLYMQEAFSSVSREQCKAEGLGSAENQASQAVTLCVQSTCVVIHKRCWERGVL